MTAKKNSLAEATPQKTFAERMQALENIVQQMESGQLSLEASLAAYAEGTQLLQACQAELQQAEQTVFILNQQQQLTPYEPQN